MVKNNALDLGDFLILLIVTALIFIMSMVFISIISPPIETKQTICEKQCKIRNLDFYEYSDNLYKNPVCNCINQTNKEIKTIYNE